ncbi:MAG: PadR family transcriptional regulator [Chloroflexota bacterium]
MNLLPDETLLGLLAAHARHGYELIDCFRDPAQLGTVWSVGTSQIYAVLKRLETQGLIAGRAFESADAPTRVEYTLTEAGLRSLEAWLDEAEPRAAARQVRVEFLSRLYITRLLNRPTLEIVRRQKASCRQRLAARIIARDTAVPGVGRLVLDLEVAQLEIILDWLDRCELDPHEESEEI